MRLTRSDEMLVEGNHRTKRALWDVKRRANKVAAMYDAAGLALSRHSSLSKLLQHVQTLPDEPEDGFASERDLLLALHALRISDAIFALEACVTRTSYLRRIARGNLDFFDRGESAAKDVLWEVEFWNTLQKRGGTAALVDPPDILLDLPSGRVAIACKKIYSEKNVEKVLSQACRQVKSFDGGIVALNLDNLVQAGSVVSAPNYESTEAILQPICDKFRSRHERHMAKYLGTGRAFSIAMVVSAACDVRGESPRFNNYSSSLFWSFKGLPPRQERLVQEFSKLVATFPSS